MTKGKWTPKVAAANWPDNPIRKALINVGIFLEGEAVVRVPVVTGRLKGSITYAIKSAQSSLRAPAAGGDKINKPSDKYTLHVGTNVEYAPSVEYGSSARGERQSLKTRRIAKATGGRQAKPYLRPALDENRGRIVKLFKEKLQEYFRGQ